MIFFVVALLTSVVFSEVESPQSKYIDGKIIDSEKGIKIPKSLMNQIHDLYYQQMLSYDSVRTQASTKQDVIKALKRKFLDVKAFMYDDVNGQLIRSTRLMMPRGGGVVDLEDILPDLDKLWFRLKIEVSSEDIDESISSSAFFKVFFISNQKSRTVDYKSYGMGCDRYIDITDYYKQVISKKAMILPFESQKYLSVIGGAFIFAYSKAENLYIGSFGIYDSRHPKLQCDLLKF